MSNYIRNPEIDRTALFAEQPTYLGHVTSVATLRSDQAKVQARRRYYPLFVLDNRVRVAKLGCESRSAASSYGLRVRARYLRLFGV